MGAETLEGGDMINGPPTALGEAQTPPRSVAAHPHPITSFSILFPLPSRPSHPQLSRSDHKNNCKVDHSRQTRHKQLRRKFACRQIAALGAGHSSRHPAFHILAFSDDGWTMTSLGNVNSSQIRKPETRPPGILWRRYSQPVIRTSAKNANVLSPLGKKKTKRKPV